MPSFHPETRADISVPPVLGCSIIVVQPEARRREILVMALNLFGHQARGVVGSEELRLALAERPAEMVLLDLANPADERPAGGEAGPVWHGGLVMLTGLASVDGRQVVSSRDVEIYVAQSADFQQLDASLRSLCRRAISASPSIAAGWWDDDAPLQLPDFDWVDTAPSPRTGCGSPVAHRRAGAFFRSRPTDSR